ncbi:hypothetical protein BKA93DRAFT_812743, partial [Sparassis latifolia]
IQHLGTVASIEHDGGGCMLATAGDSIAVNDACLTVTAFDAQARGGWFTVWLANETLERTDLGERKVGDQVNLERAMGAHVQFGGHFMQASPCGHAHVDSTATLPTSSRPSLLPYLIPKGYVAIDGASLTLTTVNDMQRTFGVMLIKHTQEKITLSKKPLGAKVNIEVDMLGKFVEKSVQAALSGGGTSNLRAMVEKVVEDVLVEKGVV